MVLCADDASKEVDMSTRNRTRDNIAFGVKRFVVSLGMLGLLFLSYGSIYWPAGWGLVGVSTAGTIIFGRYIGRRDPELVRRRQRMQRGTKGWDKVWLGFFFPLWMAILVAAGLDSGRFHWTEVPLWGRTLGLIGYVISMIFTFWAMASNTHFEGTVRIQTDRDHQVIDRGPYGYVRHPGYVAFVLMMLSLPALLGSLAAYLPAAVVTLMLVLRTALEDSTLKRELAGYLQYAERVRYRLVPGVW